MGAIKSLLIFFFVCFFSVFTQESYYTIEDFPSINKFDTHIHIEKADPILVKQAITDNFHLLSVNGDWGPVHVEQQQQFALKAIKANPKQVSLASSFEVKDWNDKDWQKKTIAWLKNSFEKGAVAVKVWKNIGMELRDINGKFVMIDDPRFDPILDFIEKNNITLLSHQGEPKNCWLPLDSMTVKGDRSYFSENPQYHMYLHPEYPSYDDQINARDHMVAKHPKLRIVSVHLASLEWNVDEIAKRLDKYPNMAVDMAARIEHLQNAASKDWQKVRDFFIRYQDRILYGTDIVESTDNSLTENSIHTRWMNDFRFIATDDDLTNSDNVNYKGLHLPKEVVDKVYGGNAQKWIPGLKK